MISKMKHEPQLNFENFMSKHNNQNQDQTPVVEDANELIAQLQAKLDDITASGKQPYPNTFKRTDYAQDLQMLLTASQNKKLKKKRRMAKKHRSTWQVASC